MCNIIPILLGCDVAAESLAENTNAFVKFEYAISAVPVPAKFKYLEFGIATVVPL